MVTYQSSTSFTAGNATSISGVSKPASTAVGDVLVAQLSIENAGEAPTIASTGDTWTLVHSINNPTPTPDLYLHVWICVVANASSTIGVTWGGGSFWRDFAVHRFTGVHATTPQDATATENQGTSTTVTGTGLTTASANAHLVVCSATLNGQAHGSWSSPLTERNDSENVAMASGDQASAGASGDKTATITSDSWCAILLALRPDGAASAPTVVGAGTVAFTASNGATLSPGLPTGWAENDIHVMIAARSDNTAMTSLSGWTQLSAGNNTTAQVVEVWARRAVSGDTAPTVTFGSGTVVRGARIIGVRGVPTTTALADLPISRSDNAASATITFATLTPPQATNRLLALYAYEDDPTAASQITNWSTFTVSTSALGSDMALGYAEREWATANSATGALTSTASGGTFANSVNVGFLLALSGVEASPIEAAAGVSAGVSTAAGTLTATVKPAGAAAGASTASGTLRATVPLAATVAATSTTTGALAATVPLAGAAAGASTAGGSATVETLVPVAGVVAGASTTAGSLISTAPVAASCAGVSAVSGTLAGAVAVSGTSGGVSTAAGTAGAVVPAAGATAGASTATGALTETAGGQEAAAGTSAGVSTVSGALTALVVLAGSSAGSSTAGAATSATVPLAGSSAAASTAAATAATSGQVAAAGVSAGASSASGTLSAVVAVAAAAAGQSATAAAVIVAGVLAGAAAGASSAAGAIAVNAALVGAAAGTASITAALTGGSPLFPAVSALASDSAVGGAVASDAAVATAVGAVALVGSASGSDREG